MFDDPNLHGSGYGFLDYRTLIEHAAEHNYHAAMATVPFDAWCVSSKAIGLFRTHSARLSLLIHGNNHTQSELAQPYPEKAREQLVAQTLKRISRLEGRLGSPVPKIMAAPHGACSDLMAKELLRQGYEAACISWGSLRKHNPQKVWPPDFGLEPAEFLGGGLPVIPRFRVSRDSLADVVLSAFLGQPIIPVGHHQDVAGGLDLLAQVSGMINEFGGVTWCDMGQIARTNFKTRLRGDVFEVRMYSCLVRVHVPRGITRLKVERAWNMPDDANERLEARFKGDDWASQNGDEVSISRDEKGTRAVDLRFTFGRGVDYRAIKSPAFRPWPVMRRILVEARDRMQPMIRR
ncbi:MAG: hypothetical protein H0W04_05270 [Chthoniobacterales bacterium]|nr:hypothetical protein [Chthoniobacterales bacterium]